MKKKEKETISANDINKYIYCPYQWYYEKVYGIKELKRLKQELNEKYGYVDVSLANFKKGQKFHNSYYNKNVNKSRLKIAFYLLCLILGIALGVYFYWIY